MESKDVIKALEYCSEHGMCDDCPYQHKQYDCSDYLKTDALELIENQQAEIERLKDILDKKVIEFAYEKKQEIKIEAYKEFVEKVTSTICKNTYPDFDKDGKAVIVWNIDGYKAIENLAKELTERKEDEGK